MININGKQYNISELMGQYIERTEQPISLIITGERQSNQGVHWSLHLSVGDGADREQVVFWQTIRPQLSDACFDIADQLRSGALYTINGIPIPNIEVRRANALIEQHIN